VASSDAIKHTVGTTEAQRLLDYEQLALKPFYAGGNVRWNGGFHLVSDPFRHPVDAVGTLLPWHPIGSIVDKILVGILRLQVRFGRGQTLCKFESRFVSVPSQLVKANVARLFFQEKNRAMCA
jgi:hypothetical protein